MYDATRLSVCISICVSAAADSGAGGIADPAAVTVETLALAAHAAIGKTEDVPRPAVHARRMRVEPTEARWGHCSLCAMLTMLDAGVIIALYRFISRLIMMMRARARATQKNTSLWDCTTNLPCRDKICRLSTEFKMCCTQLQPNQRRCQLLIPG
jgi:hypothetical protein